MVRSRLVPALGVLALAFSRLLSAQSFQHAPAHSPQPSRLVEGGLPPCAPTTITESSSQTVTALNSISCNTGSPNFFHHPNSYWRAFTLADFSIDGAFAVCAVEIGVEEAVAGPEQSGLQPITVRLYKSDGAFPAGTLTLIGSVDTTVADQTGTVLGIPVSGTAPAGSQLVVEIFTPDGVPDSNQFFIGSNSALQTGASYISAASCAVTTPTDVTDVGAPNMHIVMNVIGQVLSIDAAGLAVDQTGAGNLNGVLEIGETATVQPTWTNTTETTFSLFGFATDFDGPSGPFYVLNDDAATYGDLAPATPVNCAADCYAVTITGGRPTQHFDAQLTEQPQPVVSSVSPPVLPVKVWTLHVGESFTDVPTTNQFYKFIETIFHKGVTGGCGVGTDYCPDGTTLRKQMAVFLLKAKLGSDYVPPACTGTVFTDVPCTGGIFDPWIEDLSGRGITGGCGGGDYCPDDPVTRAQMSVFLLKTEFGPGYKVPACTGMVFLDVPCTGGIFDPWIEALAGLDVTGGCGGGNYCPNDPNTRGQMAVFLTKTFGLVLYGP